MYGPPRSSIAKKVMILGAGELGKELIIELQRLGVETIAVDRYPNAPGMQVSHRAYTIDMLNGEELRRLIQMEQPDLVVPEIEAIATDTLVAMEQEGLHVIPTAQAARLTMDREGIRRLAAEQLGVPTARYAFADSLDALRLAVAEIGTPCVIKPLMSSSGKGQRTCHTTDEIADCWEYARSAGRVANTRVIVESFIPFESEITLLTVRSVSGTQFCAPIGHLQEDGDYVESWQPHGVSEVQLAKAQEIARTVTDALGGYGVFGVELFLCGDDVYFSEVSPRPHDTGLVTLGTQDLSEFALHARAILGFPIPSITLQSPGASAAIKAAAALTEYRIDGVTAALSVANTQVRLFGKPQAHVGRRMAVVVSTAENVEQARQKATAAAAHIRLIPAASSTDAR